jgi:HEAT repeat protein
LATEALLAFNYDQIQQPLIQLINNSSLPENARLNGIRALRLQRDIRAIVQLIELLGDSNPNIVNAASEALNLLGIPTAGLDKATRKQMIEEIQRIGKDEFLRYWEMRQGYEKQIAVLKEKRNWWKQRYLTSLDEFYTAVAGDETSKAKFLLVRLSSAEPEVRLWALTKVRQWWVGTETKSKLLPELGPALITLISDENRDVRLSTAQLVSLMGELDSAKTLLEQIKLEKDDAVRTEQFIALSQACRYAFSSKSTIKLDLAIRRETLQLALQYLNSQQPDKAQKGAEVMRSLLEYDGLTKEQANAYLTALAKRYEQNDQSAPLAGELLNSMAMLCGQSIYKAQAAGLYEKYFIQALGSETSLVREAAVNGLINIDKSAALKRLRQDFANDADTNIRKQLITLAEQVGTVDDLPWLLEKVSSNTEGAAAWKAMLEIFADSSVSVLSGWTPKLEQKGIGNSRMIAFLEMTERKAEASQKAAILRTVRAKLAEIYAATGQFERSAEYLGSVIKEEKDPNQHEQLTAQLVGVYLAAGNIKAAALLVNNRLLEADIDPQSPLTKVINDYLNSPPASIDPRKLVDEFSMIDITAVAPRPQWKQLLSEWSKLFAVVVEPPKPPTPNDVKPQQIK